jgi:uncharacterized protein (TIGR02466 family)
VSGLEDKLAEHSAIPLFPTLIWASQLRPDVAARINQALLRKLDEARGRHPDLQPRGKWQTDQNLHRVAELAELVETVTGVARQILDREHIRYAGIEVTGCWANVGFPGSRHRTHAHPNNYLSGVYYVKAPPGGNTINFLDPRPQAAGMVPPSSQMSPLTSQRITIDVRPGTLLLFPAWLGHSVDTNRAREERISVAFNLMFTRFAEDMSPPMWQGNLQVSEPDG